MIKDKSFYKKVSIIAIPIALQNLVLSSINVADVFMIGKLGEVPLASLGLANQIMFLLSLFLFGINSGASVLTAQFWGKKDIKNIKKVLGIALSLSLIVSLGFYSATQLIPDKLIALYSPDKDVVLLGAEYLKVVGVSYVFTAISFAFAIQLRNLALTKVSVYGSVISLFINIILNYILIFGKFGLEPMGVSGAALSTTIARLFEMLFIVGYTFLKKYPIAGKLKEYMSFDRKFLASYFAISLPVIINEILWALGITCYSMIYARMGTSQVATVNIVNSIERIIFTAFIGIGNATAVMIGNKVGEGDLVEAKKYGKTFAILAFSVGILGSAIVFLIAKPILGIYDLSNEVNNLAYLTLMSLCFIIPFKAFNSTTIVGILRGGGDTKYALIIDILALWLMGVPLTLLAGLKYSLPIYIVFLVAGSEEFVKFTLGVARLKSGKWARNVVENIN